MSALSLSTAKAHLRVDGSDDDTLIAALVASAEQLAEHLTGRTLITRSRSHLVSGFGDRIRLPGAPVASITSVKYLDTTGAEVTLSNTLYALESGTDWPSVVPVVGATWPAVQPGRADAVRIAYSAGYGADDTAVPSAIKQWMLLCVGTWYNLRESVAAGVSVAELPRGAWDALLDPYRVDMGL